MCPPGGAQIVSFKIGHGTHVSMKQITWIIIHIEDHPAIGGLLLREPIYDPDLVDNQCPFFLGTTANPPIFQLAMGLASQDWFQPVKTLFVF